MPPPARILAAVDFSERSRVALGFAARLACQFKSELHVVHAQDPLLSAAAQHHKIDLTRETDDELRAFAGATWPVTRCASHFHVMVGPPSTAVAHAADRERADVIVMAAHGMTGPERALLGSTTEGVLRRSNVSVLVVPDAWKPASPDAPDLHGEGPLVVGMDFRTPAIEAATDAAALAASLHAELILVHIVPSLHVLARWRERAEAALVERVAEAKRDMERIAATVSGGVPTRAIVERGAVASRLAEIARTHPHTIVAVGRSVYSQGYAPPGKTACRVLTQSHAPVLMHVAR